MSQKILIITLVLLFSQPGQSKDKRSRGEGLSGVMASNTVGLGNIFFQGGFRSYFQTKAISSSTLYSMVSPEFQGDLKTLEGDKKDFFKKDFFFSPELHAVVGLISFMHFEASSIPWTGEKIGKTTARLKLTLPGNDNLRTIGFGAAANVTLSTEENTVNIQEETPAFDPIISFTGIMDVDFIKKYPDFPAKLYLNYSNLDNYRLHRFYTQHALALAFEWKQLTKSAYVKSGFALYQKKAVESNLAQTKSGSTVILDLGLGYRMRFRQVLPFTLSFETLFDPLSPMRFLKSELHRSPVLSIFMQMPLYFKETNAEAIRSLVFSEQARKSGKTGITLDASKLQRASELSIDSLMQQNAHNNLFEDNQIQILLEQKEKETRLRKRRQIYRDFVEETNIEEEKPK